VKGDLMENVFQNIEGKKVFRVHVSVSETGEFFYMNKSEASTIN